MEGEILLSMSGIAISLTGFTGVVSVLSQRNERRPTVFDRFLLNALLQWSLIAAFSGLLPCVLGALDAPPTDMWRQCMAVLVAVHSGSALWTLVQIRALRFAEMRDLDRVVVLSGYPFGLAILSAQFSVASGYLPEPRFAYTASVAYFLSLAATAFSFSLMQGLREAR